MGRSATTSAMDESFQSDQLAASPRRSLLRKWRDSIVFNKDDTPMLSAEPTPEEVPETRRLSRVLRTFSVPPKLPPELCDRTIDHLHYDRAALRACSLTCRAWLPASRLHLFRHVYLGSRVLPSFLTLLIMNRALGPYVEDVTIVTRSQGFSVPEVDQMRTLQFLKEVLDRLPSVKILRIPAFFHISVLETVILAALSKSLQAIFFSGLVIADLRALSDLLGSFPHLQSVAFSHEILWLPAIPLPPPTDGQTAPALPLRHLRISVPPKEHGAADFVKWLGSCFKLPEVRSASIQYGETFRSHGQPLGVGQLLNKLGPSLEKLEIVMPRDVRLKGMHFELSQCTRLRHISFPESRKNNDGGVIYSTQYFFPTWAAMFLSRIKTNSVRSISFTINFQSNNDLRDLAHIEEIALPLSRPEFSQLAKVEFRILGRFELQIRRFIKEELPELYARGIVSFVTSKPRPRSHSHRRGHFQRAFRTVRFG